MIDTILLIKVFVDEDGYSNAMCLKVGNPKDASSSWSKNVKPGMHRSDSKLISPGIGLQAQAIPTLKLYPYCTGYSWNSFEILLAFPFVDCPRLQGHVLPSSW
jgi:hypothetical protein